jgi:hypothetical protein
MSSSAELAELHHLINGVRRCAMSMKARYGDNPAMRRIVNDADRLLNDVDRLDIDAARRERRFLCRTHSTTVTSGVMSTTRASAASSEPDERAC